MTESKHSYQRHHWTHSYWEIPKEWAFVPIGGLFAPRRERSSDRSTFPLYSFTIENGVTAKTERYERSFLLKDSDENQFAVVHPGDFVSNPMNLRYGAIGYSRVPFPVLVSGYYDVLTPKLSKVDSHFLESFLRSPWAINLYDRIAIGSLIEKRRVHLSILNETCIPLPPLHEQQKIAAILSTWDRAIELTEKLIAAKQKRKQALMQQLLTGKVRLPGFRGQKWQLRKIGQFLTESRIAGSDGENARKITVKLYGKGVLPKIETRKGSSATQYYRRSAGQFIYSKLDFLNGAFGIIPADMDGFESTLDLPAFDISDGLDARWFLGFVSREQFYSRGFSLANGGRKARRVNPRDFLNIKIKLPSLLEQRAIADVLEVAAREVLHLALKLDALRRQKKGLMQQLLTGKVRVSIDSGTTVEVST